MPQRRVFLSHAAGSLALPFAIRADAAPPGGKAQTAISPMTIEHAGATLSAAIYLPTDEVKGGVVLVHGNGRTGKMDRFARLFAENGLAALTWDKRGVGESGGTYEELDNSSPENLALLAGDAAAAMRSLQNLPETAGKRCGYWGLSQAGWIVPLALKVRPADYIVFWSGPVCTVADEIEGATGPGGNLTSASRAKAYAAHLRATGRDTDPRTALRGVSIPGLWIAGGRDHTQPVALSIERLQGLIDEGHGNFAYWLNSAGGHDDFDANTPLVTGMVQWMLARSAPHP